MRVVFALETLASRGIANASRALDYAKSNGMVPIISFYLEPELMNRLMRRYREPLERAYKEAGFERTLFVRRALQLLDYRSENYMNFAYYATPLSDAEIEVYENNQVPVKVVPLRGKFRLTFMSYSSLNELETRVKEGNEDDVIAEFDNSQLIKIEKRRVVFMELKSIDQLAATRSKVVLNFVPTAPTFLIFPVIAMNVRPKNNKILVRRGGDEDLEYVVAEGRVKENEVIEGNTLTPVEISRMYYEWRSRKINRDLELQGLIARLPY
ncbi:hypothetical protein HS1genome_0148 [Sulfodiicoccus acidiphilus]|uniref:Uncharacterized protein n=1 Tax=Sulfodiicoccus acidiphilus TaxID=1670455 RepID=A0A348B0Q7_9CREN|nr:hypothetical protein [Sulfodiicoccus acidiphilus]BBD71759.1 hypothetical protein HS1genome_0148 [Sulfodiicoccus acidiphilus]GGT99048.1 hypothetical protein GCM10007116_15430 [Sulfodiicoccus acidiphilus]